MQRQRVVAVTTASSRGSGYAVGPRLVLTSAHVTGPEGAAVQVFHPGRPKVYAGRVVWRGTPGGRDDAALVAITDAAWTPPAGAAVRWGRTLTYRPGIPCESWGLPALVQRDDRPAELHQPSGVLNPGDRYVGDRYVMTVSGSPPEAPADGSSPWAGMSGAALMCGDLLAGVVSVDPAGRDHGYLEAVPAYVLHHDPGFRQALREHGGLEAGQGVVLEPIEFQHLAEPADPAPAVSGVGGSPAGLLRARRQVVPFYGRDQILKRLHAWTELPGFGAHLVCAPAGQGKTRLAQHLAGQLAQAGWGTLWLDRRAPDSGLDVLKDVAADLLVVVDYAESRIGQLTALLEAAARAENPCRIKVLLLARTAGSWWEALRSSSHLIGTLLENTPVTRLEALETDAEGRASAYRQAAAAFARALDEQATATRCAPGDADGGAGTPGAPPASGGSWSSLAAELPVPARLVQATVDPERAGNALTVHMTALADLLDAADPYTDHPGAAAGAAGVEDRLLEHEQRYWKATATTFGLYDPDRDGAILPSVLTDAVAAATALPVTGHEQALNLLTRIPALAGEQAAERRERIHDWLAALYPPADAQQPWGMLQPDRVAERFIGRHLTNRPHLADHLVTGASVEQAAGLLTVYARAAGHHVFDGGLDATLTALCLRHPRVLVPAAIETATHVERPAPLLAALEQALHEPGIPPDVLQDWETRLPRASQVLAEWATRLTRRLADWYRDRSSLPDLARSLNNLSVRLGVLGRREEGLAAIEEAVQVYRELARIRPDAYLPDLATSLNNLSNRLGELGRREEGLAAIEEAVAIRGKLAKVRPAVHQAELEQSLAVMAWLNSQH